MPRCRYAITQINNKILHCELATTPKDIKNAIAQTQRHQIVPKYPIANLQQHKKTSFNLN